MSFAPAMRPRFQAVIDLNPQTTRARLTEPLGEPECPVEGVLAGFHMELKIPAGQRHFWSPNLSLEVLEQDGETRISGLFGPRPSVWTLFATYYGFLVFLAFIGVVLGTSQWMVDQSPWAFWGVPAAAIGFLIGYGSALYGQRLAQDEMELLRSYLRRCFEGVEVRLIGESARPKAA